MLDLKGSMVAIVTPFKNDKIDEKSLKKLVKFHIDNNTQGIVPCGTTGESATLSFEEHNRVIDIVVEASGGKIKVIAGTGSNNTREAIELTKYAKKAGCDGALIINPYYNKPTQQGLYEHFLAISEAVNIPIVLYNIASRTGINMLPETVAKISSKSKNFVGIKEASGNLEQMMRIVELCSDKVVLISGDDALTLPVLAIGGKGVISVVANVLPAKVQGMCEAFFDGDYQTARKIHYELLPMVRAMFLETNPIPVKSAMGMLGMIDSHVRLPMTSLSDGNSIILKNILKQEGLKLI